MPYTDSLSVVLGTSTKKSSYDDVADNTDFIRDYLDIDHSFDITTATGDHKMRTTAPMHMEVDGSTVWSMGWWQAADGSWWLLVNTADAASFTRTDAEMYIRCGDIRDVPAT
jgi:hypothetical protein